MTIVREPKPQPSALDFVPENSTPYRVSNSDSWYSLADRHEVQSAGLSANDLCYFNFKTRDPAEINWYLYHKVGCRKVTRDGKNYMFSSADQPGIVYLPRIGPPRPVNQFAPKKQVERLNTWFGLGVKGGTEFVIVGIETLVGFAVSLDDFGKGMAITASINRIGPGFGASGGVCGIYVSGVKNPSQLNGHQQGPASWKDFDYNVALGPKWSKLAETTVKVKKLKPLIDIILKLGVKTPSGLKKALKANPDKWSDLIKAGRSVKEALGIDHYGGPNVFLFDLPASGGTEVSLFYAVSNFNAVEWNIND